MAFLRCILIEKAVPMRNARHLARCNIRLSARKLYLSQMINAIKNTVEIKKSRAGDPA